MMLKQLRGDNGSLSGCELARVYHDAVWCEPIAYSVSLRDSEMRIDPVQPHAARSQSLGHICSFAAV